MKEGGVAADYVGDGDCSSLHFVLLLHYLMKGLETFCSPLNFVKFRAIVAPVRTQVAYPDHNVLELIE